MESMDNLEIVRKYLSKRIREMRENCSGDVEKDKEFLALRLVFLESKQTFTYSQFVENLRHKYETNEDKELRKQIDEVMNFTDKTKNGSA
jgi:hypothetical protein